MMSEERFSLSNPINHNPIPNWVMIVHDDAEHKHMNAEEIVDFLNSLSEENRQLKQILRDIVEVTDETYTKNTSICKVIAVFDYKKYLKIKECLNE